MTSTSSLYVSQRDEEKAKRLEHYRRSLASILQGYARTLMGSERLMVSFVPGLPAAARLVKGTQVEINADAFTGIEDLSDIACTYGTVLHELGHFEYTPPIHDPLTQWVIHENLFSAFNLLEDMRLETRLARRWPTVAAWFDVVVAKHVLTKGVNDTAWLFLAGRETLSRRLRVAALKKFEGDAKRVFELATEYTRLVPSRDLDRAKEVIAEYATYLPTEEGGGGDQPGERKDDGTIRDPGDTPSKCGPFDGEQPTHNSPITEDEQLEEDLGDNPWDFSDEEQKDTDDEVSQGDDDGESDEEQDTDSDDSEDGESGDGDDDSDGDSGDSDDSDDFEDSDESSSSDDSGEDGDSGDSDEDGGETGDSPSDSDSDDSDADDQSPSTSAGTEAGDTVKDLVEQALEEALDEVKERVLSDLKRLEDADLEREAIRRFEGEGADVPPEFQALSSSFERELRVLRGLAAPGFDTNKRSGRLNTRRYIAQRDQPRRVFDRYNPGSREAVSLHIDVLIDQSGSMGAQGSRACYMAWAIKRAVDKLGSATSSIIAFDGVASTVYGPDDRVPETSTINSYTGGGTEVTPAFAQALRHCHRTKARYKAVFVLTDGEWWSNPSTEIERLHDKGVYTSLFFLSPYGRKTDDSRGLRSVINVTDTADIVNHVRNVVVEDIKKNIVIR